ncbi:class I SAM-dependent methyltransferase [Risungbinella massiliensis]|uniref:class I SAM-dependent methyltransferase n=1 Tax=Risungbinella massiliensis TaxID=1329796 RepID=UPI0005CBF5F8|nr:class I SAM-dependent methyltransferase [Risungbinella massiliensis]
MSDHYYSSKPSSITDQREIITELRGQSFRFLSDAGVFSKKGIDQGSRILIESLDIEDQSDVLDLGCGYGPIGISVAKIFSTSNVTMVDINQRAIELAKENAALNRVTERVTIFPSDGFQEVTGLYHHIITNPPIRIGKKQIYDFFEKARDYMNPNGKLWIVIRKQQGASSAVRKLEEVYDKVEVVTKDKGYWILVAQCR